MKRFPFLSLHSCLVLLRITVALILLAHATVRVIGGTIPRFAGFLNNKGLVIGTQLVWLITAAELGGGLLMILNRFTRWVALVFFLMIGIGIILIHAANGWFVGEHGSGGMEYSVVLMVALLVIAAADQSQQPEIVT
jgi:putative oxidoreductase